MEPNEIFMLNRHRFEELLTPFKEMLMSRKKSMPETEWSEFFDHLRQCIQKHPDQYVGVHELEAETASLMIAEIFNEFRTEIASRERYSFLRA